MSVMHIMIYTILRPLCNWPLHGVQQQPPPFNALNSNFNRMGGWNLHLNNMVSTVIIIICYYEIMKLILWWPALEFYIQSKAMRFEWRLHCNKVSLSNQALCKKNHLKFLNPIIILFLQLRTIPTQVVLIFHQSVKQGVESLFWTQDTILTFMDISVWPAQWP